VRLAHGYVSIDGKPLDESAYIRSRAQRGAASGIWKVPSGRFFLLGDNRNDSCDSRTWGSVAQSSLIGPVVATYWPPERIRIDH
jgi:signal peptidase I